MAERKDRFMIEAAFGKQGVAVCFASNDYFVPYLSVMLMSVLEHSTEGTKYDIIILHSDICSENRDSLERMAADRPNVSIRCIDISLYVGGLDFFTSNKEHFSAEAYYRLLIPFILPDCSKAIYLDGDMIATRDIADLWEVELGDKMIAAVRDYAGNSLYLKEFSDRKRYREEELKLTNVWDYFISGTLVMNLDAFRKDYTVESVLEMALSRNWMQHDQDILNVMCDGSVVILSAGWNVLEDYGNYKYLPEEYYKEWERGNENPYIIHYGGDRKPWLNLESDHGVEFWRYASSGQYMSVILERMSKIMVGPDKCFDVVLKQCRKGRIRLIMILQLIKVWVKAKIDRKGKDFPDPV